MKFANRWLFFVIGLVVLLVFGYGGYQIGRFFLGGSTPNDSDNLEKTEVKKKEKVIMSLGNFRELENTPYLIAPVNSLEDYRQNDSRQKILSIRNYLFVNANDKSAQLLAPTNNFLFLKAEEVFLQRRVDKIVRGMWYEVVKADTNNNQRLDKQDKKTIAVSDISGSDYTEIINGIDRVLGSQQQNSTTLLVFYELDGREYIGEINIPRRILVEQQVLPSIR